MTMVAVEQSKRIAIEGVISLLLTPFHEDRSIDWTTYDRYVDWQMRQQPAGLFAVCGSGEMKWLTAEERLRLAARAVALADGVPVVATANLDPNPSYHHDEIARMADTGVTGVVLVPQPALASDHERYVEYLLNLIEYSPCPVMLYEWPQVDHYLLDPAVVSRVAPQLSGIKDTTCTMPGISDKLRAAGDTVIYQANLPYLVDALDIGARGVMAVVSASHADRLVALWDSYRAGRDDVPRRHRDLVVLDSLLRQNYPATAKHLVARRGIPMTLTTRWPTDIPAETIKALDVWFDNDHAMMDNAMAPR